MSAMEQMLSKALGINVSEMKEIIDGLTTGLKSMIDNQEIILKTQDEMNKKLDALLLERNKDG